MVSTKELVSQQNLPKTLIKTIMSMVDLIGYSSRQKVFWILNLALGKLQFRRVDMLYGFDLRFGSDLLVDKV